MNWVWIIILLVIIGGVWYLMKGKKAGAPKVEEPKVEEKPEETTPPEG